jgi:hypothetical protein
MLEGATKRRLLLAAGVAAVAAFCVAAILLAGSGAREVARDAGSEEGGQRSAVGRDHAGEPGGFTVLTEEEALVQDARWYAKDLDVSVEEAIRRLEMQDDTLPTDLERELKETESDAFAGLWLRHKPDYGITVATAGDPEAMMDKIEPIVAGTQWEGTIRIKRVEATEAELKAARAEAERIFNRLDIPHDSGDNIMKNRMEFFVANKARFERELRASGLKVPEHVVVLEGLARPDVVE